MVSGGTPSDLGRRRVKIKSAAAFIGGGY